MREFLDGRRPGSSLVAKTPHQRGKIKSTFGCVNTLFLAAAQIVEDKTGLSWEDNLDVSIFGPLGMTETTAHPEVVATLTNIARGHIGTASGEPWPIPDDWTYGDWIDTYGPAGGIRSNVLDMTKWIRMQLGRGTFEGNQLVSAENIAAMHDPKVFIGNQVKGAVASYASAWVYNSFSPYPIVWHDGATSGMHSIVALIPKANIGVMGPKQLDVPLVSFSGNTFTGLMPDMPAESDSEILVTFVVPTGGNAREMVIDVFADVNGGRFTRASNAPPARFGERRRESASGSQ